MPNSGVTVLELSKIEPELRKIKLLHFENFTVSIAILHQF